MARKKGAEGSYTLEEWDLLKKEFDYTCPACTLKEPEIKLTVDHIIPLIKGGSDYIENIQPLCLKCNSKKNIKIINYWEKCYMVFFGKIKNQKLTINNLKNFNRFISSLKNGCVVEIVVKKWRKKRSLNQNSLYWVWLQIISEDLGYTTEELHDSFRSMFLTDRSKKIPLIRSTTALNTLEFIQYLKKIEKEANELGIILPANPNHYE